MSGIWGVLDYTANSISDSILSAMARRISHRGPDRTNFYINLETGIGLGQNHLNAFAADASPSTPGFAKFDNLVCGYDGHITNAPEVAQINHSWPGELENLEARAIWGAYRTYGDDCLARLDGPFSLAIWDNDRKRLLLSRDKLGEKSVYYYSDSKQNTIIFASEIKGILAHPGVRAELDMESLSAHLVFGYVPGPKTLFKNIFKLLPGESLYLEPSGRLKRRKYWRLPPIQDGIQDETFCIRQLRELFLKGLERYVNGCQQVGVFLSGGVDSSILVIALRELGVPRISTFTIGFDVDSTGSQKQEDLGYARLVADKYGTDHHEIVVGPDHIPGERLLRVIKQFDDLVMTPNMYSKYLLAEAAREAGINSILTGSAAAGACGIHRQFLNHKQRAKWIKKTQVCATDEERYYKLRGRVFSLEEQEKLLLQPPPIGKEEIVAALHHYIGDVQSSDFFRRFLFSNLMITSTEKSVRVLDKVGMMNSVEMRAPYLDRALVEFSTQLPTSFDHGKTFVSLKTHLQKAFEDDLPRPVLDRRVIGYPSYYWNNGELAEFQQELLSREAITRAGIFNYDYVMQMLQDEKHSRAKSAGKHSWAITQISLWYEIHIKQNPEYVS